MSTAKRSECSYHRAKTSGREKGYVPGSTQLRLTANDYLAFICWLPAVEQYENISEAPSKVSSRLS